MSDESDRRATVKRLEAELGGYRPDWSRSKEDKQLLLENRLLKEEAQKRARRLEERARAGEFTPAIKSALRKRVEARKRARERAIKKGGVLAQ